MHACKPGPTMQPCNHGRALMELFLQMCRRHDCSIQEEGEVSAYETIHHVTQTIQRTLRRCSNITNQTLRSRRRFAFQLVSRA